jgi:hypothetical protein
MINNGKACDFAERWDDFVDTTLAFVLAPTEGSRLREITLPVDLFPPDKMKTLIAAVVLRLPLLKTFKLGPGCRGGPVSCCDVALRYLANALPHIRHLKTLEIYLGLDVQINEAMSEQARGLLRDGFVQNRSITKFRVVGGGTTDNLANLWSVPRLQYQLDLIGPAPPVGLLSHLMARRGLAGLDRQTVTFLTLQQHADHIWAPANI